MVFKKEYYFRTNGNFDIVNITDHVIKAVNEAGMREGMILIFSPSSTSAITTTEYENGCIADLREWFESVIPEGKDYAHNARWGDGNGHSHLRASILGASFTCPINEGRIVLGTWQQIIFVDFDNKPRNRKLIFQFVGDST